MPSEQSKHQMQMNVRPRMKAVVSESVRILIGAYTQCLLGRIRASLTSDTVLEERFDKIG